jgi:hypothetical protein
MMRRKQQRTKFVYTPPSKETIKKRASGGGSLNDPYIKESIAFFTPKEGKNKVRILPPTWESPEHWSYEIYIHYGIGADNLSYLCLARMKDKDCPVCEERRKAQADGDQDYASTIAARTRYLVWVIDRENESEGPLLWSQPSIMDQELSDRAYDVSTGEVLEIDNPEEGYDVTFTREGTGIKTRYIAINISRHVTSITEKESLFNRWMETVVDNPIPTCLNFYDYDHINKAFSGVKKVEEEVEEIKEEELPRPRVRREVEKEEEYKEEDEKIEDVDENDYSEDDEKEVGTRVARRIRQRREGR